MLFLSLLAPLFVFANEQAAGFNHGIDGYKSSGQAIIRHITHLRGRATQCAPSMGSNFIAPANDVIKNMQRDLDWLDKAPNGFRQRVLKEIGDPIDVSQANVCRAPAVLAADLEKKRKYIANSAKPEFKTNIQDKIKAAADELRAKQSQIEWLFSTCPNETKIMTQAMNEFTALQRKVTEINGMLDAWEKALKRHITSVGAIRCN